MYLPGTDEKCRIEPLRQTTSETNSDVLSTVELATNGECQTSTLDDVERPWTTMNVTYQVG